MSGYPHNPPGYGGGPPAQPYAASHHQGAAPSPYGQPPPHNPDKPPKDSHGYGYGAAPSPYGQPPPHNPDKPPKDSYGYGYGAASHQQGAAPSPYGQPPSHNPDKPPKDSYGHGYGGGQPHYGGSAPPTNQQYGSAAPPSYGNPFAVLVPSAFPPGTDPSVVACFQVADQDGSGLIDDKELQRALSSYNQSFSLRTVHLLMYHFTDTNSRKIGPKEFTALFYGLQNWRSIFERFDRDRSGKIDAPELREALLNLGYAVSPLALDLLVLKFDKTGGKSKAIEYDNFIECCLVVKGLTDKFKAKDTKYSGSATFSYEEFMVTVLPFLVA